MSANMSKPTRWTFLQGSAHYVGLRIARYSPGDGMTRYRFFPIDDPSDYFGPSNGVHTALGMAAAEAWIEGYRAGRTAGMDAMIGKEVTETRH
jgi:hypothetical protein